MGKEESFSRAAPACRAEAGRRRIQMLSVFASLLFKSPSSRFQLQNLKTTNKIRHFQSPSAVVSTFPFLHTEIWKRPFVPSHLLSACRTGPPSKASSLRAKPLCNLCAVPIVALAKLGSCGQFPRSPFTPPKTSRIPNKDRPMPPNFRAVYTHTYLYIQNV